MRESIWVSKVSEKAVCRVVGVPARTGKAYENSVVDRMKVAKATPT